MKPGFLALLCGIVACGNSPGDGVAAPEDSSAVRALTWNVQQSSSGRVDQQTDLIASTQPDVVVLQEAYRGEVEHFRAGLASVTGRSWTARYAPAVRRQDRNEGAGVVILSAFPVLASDSIQMPFADEWTESRPLLRVRVQAPGATVAVVTTHLSPGEQGRSARGQQIRRLLEWAAGSNDPILLGGDFNAEPLTDELGLLRTMFGDVWTELGRSGGETFSSDHPTRRIDYWFVGHAGNGSAASADATVVSACRGGVCLSDHNAVLAVIAVARR